MGELGVLKRKVAAQERRIKKLEAAVYEDVSPEDSEKGGVDVVEASSVVSKVKSKGSGFSFNQVITFLGILGIGIGAVSFFFYAVANGWIGKGAQVGIGVLFGLVLFVLAYGLRDRNLEWSNVVFGGAYFLEYLSIGVGVSVYEVMPASVGVLFGFLILCSSIVLTAKFGSRMIGYFSLVGGFLIPIITDTFESQVFIMVWYLLIVMAMTAVSTSFNWGDLRAVLLALIFIYMVSSFGSVGNGLEFLFLGVCFILFNVSSLVNVVFNEKEANILDSLMLALMPLLFLPLLYSLLENVSDASFGLLITLFSFVYLIEAGWLKGRGLKFPNVVYSLIAAGVTVLNFGIYFLFREIFGLEYFMIFFIVQWALFGFLAAESKDGFYRVVSYVFLFLIAVWYVYVLRFKDSLGHSSFFMVVLIVVPLIAFVYFRKNIDYRANAATFIISGYLVIYSFYKYIWWIVPSISDAAREVVLSVLWLIYTLVLFVQVQAKGGKMLVGFLLGFTLLKIAFKDLFFLSTGLRIVGFIIFGILLLIGGYFLKNEK